MAIFFHGETEFYLVHKLIFLENVKKMDYFCDDFFVDFFNGVIVWLNGKAPHIDCMGVAGSSPVTITYFLFRHFEFHEYGVLKGC